MAQVVEIVIGDVKHQDIIRNYVLLLVVPPLCLWWVTHIVTKALRLKILPGQQLPLFHSPRVIIEVLMLVCWVIELSSIVSRRQYEFTCWYLQLQEDHIQMKKSLTWVNSLLPSDVIWQHRFGTTLVQVMACCLTAPSHYLNQFWLTISEVLWHSPEGNFTNSYLALSLGCCLCPIRWSSQKYIKDFYPWYEFENC